MSFEKVSKELLKRLSDEKIEEILTTSANKIYKDIYNLAPVDTGKYRNSIKISDVEHQNGIHSIEIYSDLNSGWNNVALGYLLEWGTGTKGENTNDYPHGYPYRQTPWVYYNERYGKWIFTYGCVARPHWYPGLHNNESYFKEQIRKGVTK